MEPPDQANRPDPDEHPNTPHDAADEPPVPGEDAYTAPQAARVLGLSDRRVRQMLEGGDLEGERDGSGKWWIPQRAVHAALEDRGSPRSRGREQRAASRPDTAGEAPAATQRAPGGPESVRELVQRVESLSYRLGRSEARAELTEKAESTLREDRDRLARELEEERAERRRLVERLERLEGASLAPTTPPPAASGPTPDDPTKTDIARGASEGEPPSAKEEQTARRPWWLRWLGG